MFKVNDKVKVIATKEELRAEASISSDITNKVGTIIDIDINDSLPYDVEFDDGETWYLAERHLKKQERPQDKFNSLMREFDSGATRDTDQDKLDYEGFNSPLVDKRYAEYLHKHRQTANGLRDSDNWQGLFGAKHTDVCIKSLCRHVVDTRLAHRGYKSEQPIEDSLCAIIFNAKAYLFKLLEAKELESFSDLNVNPETKPGYGGDTECSDS